jgi:hypothetical protein
VPTRAAQLKRSASTSRVRPTQANTKRPRTLRQPYLEHIRLKADAAVATAPPTALAAAAVAEVEKAGGEEEEEAEEEEEEELPARSGIRRRRRIVTEDEEEESSGGEEDSDAGPSTRSPRGWRRLRQGDDCQASDCGGDIEASEGEFHDDEEDESPSATSSVQCQHWGCVSELASVRSRRGRSWSSCWRRHPTALPTRGAQTVWPVSTATGHA